MISLPLVADPLTIVASAVTPVVMVSSTAILISGVNSRYMAVSDRVRSLAHEFRTVDCGERRKNIIRLQMVIFHRRIELVSWALRLLYIAAGLFVSIALLIGVSMWRRIFGEITLPIFICGLVLVATAIALQFSELQLSNKTIVLESADILTNREAEPSGNLEPVETSDLPRQGWDGTPGA
jgi:hypothetical protein